MRLTERVHLVGSGRTGFNLSDPYDCHVYLIDGGSELALVDAGVGLATEIILGNVRRTGFEPARIGKILLTHAHADHAGGAAGLRAATGADVLPPLAAAAWIESADEAAISLPAARRAGMYPPDYRFAACSVARGLADAEVVSVGELALQVLDTPGHAAAHCAFLLDGDDRRTLFAGDVVFHGGRILLLNTPDCSIQDLASSLARLRDLEFDALFPGHGLLSCRGGHEHVEMAAATFDRLAVPPGMF